jgi:hypothetical protein
MNYDWSSRSPRLILDENIDSSSVDILLRHGLDQRCSRVYQSWCEERRRNDHLMQQRISDTIAAGRRDKQATVVRIMNGLGKWLAGQAVARYPCV